jgi:hypothetical protein
MSTRESKVFTRLKGYICHPDDRFDRIENGLAPGWPDVNYVLAGVEGWIELKAPVEPVKPSTPLFGSNHQVSLDQRNWFLRQLNARGRCWLLIGTDKRLMLLHGWLVAHQDVNKLTIDQLRKSGHCRWECVPPVKDQFEWATLRTALTMG